MDVGAAFVADAEAAELVQPGCPAPHTPTNEPNMVRRTAMTLNGRSYLSYDYGATNNINDQLSRVQSLSMGMVTRTPPSTCSTWPTRSTPTQDTDTYDYDAVGNLTHERSTVVNGILTSFTEKWYVYDAFGRLRRIETNFIAPGDEDSARHPIVQYRYNGLGFRTMWQYDVDASGTLEDSERYYFAYDERWRIIAT